MIVKLNFRLLVALVLICCICSVLSSDRKNKLNLNKEQSLPRKRRYLVFPEGSSFQVSKYCFLPNKAKSCSTF